MIFSSLWIFMRIKFYFLFEHWIEASSSIFWKVLLQKRPEGVRKYLYVPVALRLLLRRIKPPITDKMKTAAKTAIRIIIYKDILPFVDSAGEISAKVSFDSGSFSLFLEFSACLKPVVTSGVSGSRVTPTHFGIFRSVSSTQTLSSAQMNVSHVIRSWQKSPWNLNLKDFSYPIFIVIIYFLFFLYNLLMKY